MSFSTSGALSLFPNLDFFIWFHWLKCQCEYCILEIFWEEKRSEKLFKFEEFFKVTCSRNVIVSWAGSRISAALIDIFDTPFNSGTFVLCFRISILMTFTKIYVDLLGITVAIQKLAFFRGLTLFKTSQQ